MRNTVLAICAITLGCSGIAHAQDVNELGKQLNQQLTEKDYMGALETLELLQKQIKVLQAAKASPAADTSPTKDFGSVSASGARIRIKGFRVKQADGSLNKQLLLTFVPEPLEIYTKFAQRLFAPTEYKALKKATEDASALSKQWKERLLETDLRRFSVIDKPTNLSETQKGEVDYVLNLDQEGHISAILHASETLVLLSDEASMTDFKNKIDLAIAWLEQQ